MSIQVAFVGCGQIGGSLLLRARDRYPQAKLCVVDREEARASILASGAVDQWGSIAEIVPTSDIVVLGTPLEVAREALIEVLDHLQDDALVMDVMSVKRPLHLAALGHKHVGRFVGGHPMFGSEGNGFAAANPAWVDDAPFILTHTSHTDTTAIIRAKDFVHTLGAQVVERDPEQHDLQLAAVSHLPQALASVLAGFVDEEAFEVHGPGFRDMTRLALSAPSFWAQVFHANADILRPMIDRYAHELLRFSRTFDVETLQQGLDAKRRIPRLEQGTLCSRVSESSTGLMLRRVLSMQERGIKVLGLHVGEPKIAASKAIRDLVRDAMAKAPIVYTATVGTTELRAKIAEVASEVLNRDVADEETLVAVGAKQALHLALASLIAPGDEVLVISPAWGSFVETVQLAGGKPVHVHADPEAIAQAITRRTRAIIVNSPNNPTGEVYSQAKIEALLKPCNDAGLWLISDELYRAYAFDAPHVSAASLYDETRTVWLDGVAKSHAMTGLRIGYAVAPRALIGKMAKLASHETSCASSVTQAAATALLTAHPHGDTQLIAQIKALRSKVHATLGDRLGAPMQGAFYAWLKVGPDSRRICDRLLTEHHVATMFGEAFGARGFLRLSYAIDASSLERALLRVKNAL